MSKKSQRLLEKVALPIIGSDNKKLLVKGLDVIGDIGVLKFPEGLEKFKRQISQGLLKEVPYIKVVLEQSAPVSGDYRIRGYTWLAGEQRTTTVHKEFGCLFKVDLGKAYFSPRLSAERERIASQIADKESTSVSVLNMFAGVGCFSIIIAKRAKNTKIYSVDINRQAFEYMVQNVYLNKVRGQVVSILGDATNIIDNHFQRKVDRVLMPLPEKAKDYFNNALIALKPDGGIIHYQTFVYAEKGVDPKDIAKKEVEDLLKNKKHEIVFSRIIRDVGPRWFHVAEDIMIRGPMN